MAQCKASQVSQYITSPDTNCCLILLYGPDSGLISENAGGLAKNLGFSKTEPFTVLNFDLDELASEQGKLLDEANAISMFSDRKLIRLTGSTRRNIIPILKLLLENPPINCWIIIESVNLKKDSALRKIVEQSARAMALPCYQDGAQALDMLIDQEIVSNGISITKETRLYLHTLLGEDRRTSRNELRKLAVFATGESEITQTQITALLGNVSAVGNDEIIDAVAAGRIEFLEFKLDQLIEFGTRPDMLLLAGLRHFQVLHALKAKMISTNANSASLIAGARPPIHFSRRNSVINSLNNWSISNLNLAIRRLDTAVLKARKNTRLANALAATTFLALSLLAVRRS